MNFFKSQDEAVELFDRIKPAADKHRVIFLVVPTKDDIIALRKDLEILLQRFNIKVSRGKLKIKGTKSNPAQTILFSTKDDYEDGRLQGVPKDAIIRVTQRNIAMCRDKEQLGARFVLFAPDIKKETVKWKL